MPNGHCRQQGQDSGAYWVRIYGTKDRRAISSSLCLQYVFSQWSGDASCSLLFQLWGKAAVTGGCLEEPAQQASPRRVFIDASLVLQNVLKEMACIILLVGTTSWSACSEKHREGGLPSGSEVWLPKISTSQVSARKCTPRSHSRTGRCPDDTAYERILLLLIGCRESVGFEGFNSSMRHGLTHKCAMAPASRPSTRG